MKKILAPSVDGSFGYRAARTLVNTAMQASASITLLRLNAAQALSERDQLVMQECRRAGVAITERWSQANPVTAIVETAEQGGFDLIVMGIDPNRHIDESLATEVLGVCEVPVLAIPVGDWSVFRPVDELQTVVFEQPESENSIPRPQFLWHPASVASKLGLMTVLILMFVSGASFLLAALTRNGAGQLGTSGHLSFTIGIVCLLAAAWCGFTIDHDNQQRPRRGAL